MHAPLFRDLNVMTALQINLIYSLLVAFSAYRVFNNLLPLYFNDMLISNGIVNKYSTRQCYDYHSPYRRLVLASNSLSVYGVDVWNNIQEDFWNTTSLMLFRTKYKLYLKSHSLVVFNSNW